ncbi:signal protein [Xylanimonas allomyrinae]|uniref:Signal protein n=1 Tax=Xylanimonas allomyrinae TaxID=2509459 RepID=A0A4P6EX18_9MICO|nr:signal protein [Xylanimonas allomyrinae]QAY62558.1 signal protein [Xylanimonas allomyrinae]
MHNVLGGYTAYASPSEIQNIALNEAELGNVGTSVSLSVSYSLSLSWSWSWT